MLLSQSDHERVRAAVERAEKRTSAEIVCVLARQSGDYLETPLAWAGVVALLAPAVALLAGLKSRLITDQFPDLLGGWTAGNAGSVDATIGQALIAYVVLQAALFALIVLIVSWRPLRLAMTPKALKREHAHRKAAEQFAAQAYHLTSGRTGVLIFASLAERQAVVIADTAVAAKLKPDVWNDVVGELLAGMKSRNPGAGFAAAVDKAAAHLEGPFERAADDRNELPDTVIELDH
jgi:putative membrane protein